MGKYILDDNGNPLAEHDIIRWAKWFEKAERHIADDTINGYRVSTVFLGIDHNFGGGVPILWETMIFGPGELNEWQDRYHTKREAMEGHARAVQMAIAGKELVEA